MQPNFDPMAEAFSPGFSDSDGQAPVTGNTALAEIGSLLSGRGSIAFGRIRDRLWENFEQSQCFLSECSEKIETESKEADARGALHLALKFTEGVERQAKIFESLTFFKEAAAEALRQEAEARQGNNARSVPRSSRRHKPPVIVDAELS